MLSLSSGHSAEYLTGAVAAGRENYYTGAVAAGEPPGRWWGRGAESLGLAGDVDTQDMIALYERLIDPRDEAFRDPVRWDEAATLGHTGRRYLSEDEIYEAALKSEPGADAERRAALRVEAGKKARKNVAFIDATFSVQKSITVLHTAFEAQEVRARSAAEQARTALAALANSDSEPDSIAAAGARGAGGALHRTVSRTVSGAVHRSAELAAVLAAAEAEAAAWAEHRRAVEDAIWAGNQAALDYLSEKAGYSRVGHHGGAAGRWVDAHDWTVASFFQHDSRNHDPQLHIHNAILNRVEGPDGKWRTLDSRALHKYRGAAAAVGERVMEQHMTRALGVEFATRPDGEAREIVGIEQGVMDLFSSRRRAITRKTQTLVAAFETKFGRAPNSLELDRLQRQATFASRRAKSHDGETVEQRLDRWDRELRAEVRGGMAQVAEDVLGQRHQTPRAGRGERWRAREVIETALAEVQETKAAWTAPDLTRAISNALPDQLGRLSPEQVTRLLDGLTEQALALVVPLDAARPGEPALPAELRRADGTSAYEAPGSRLYATPAHVHTERILSAASVDRGAPGVSAATAGRFLTELATAGVSLGADQAAAVRGILTSGARVETLVGPAGTGKSFVVGALARAWQDAALWDGTRRRVVGLATSQIATEVLAGEGLAARNIARWLATQDRLADDRPSGDDKAWRLRAGDLVVVDESAMADTTALARIHAVCADAGAKLLLTGDHRQLAAVGAGGGMELVSTAGDAIAGGLRHELTETRRFRADWEGPASLRLRDHDPTVLADYHKHGRLVDGGAIEQTEQAAARAWLADTLSGRHALLIVDTNEQAARLAAHLRGELVRLGLVDEHAVPLGLQGTYAGRGDLIQARRNAWELAGRNGNQRSPINREQYRVLDTLPDGGLIVAPITGRATTLNEASGGGTGSGAAREVLGEPMTLPASYVAEHVALGYASTVHAAQGLTVDTSHVVATSTTGIQALYVGMTRGRHANTAHVVTRAVPDVPGGAPTGQALQAVHRSPRAVLAGAFDAADTIGATLSALAEAAESAAAAGSMRTPGELFADAAELATAGRTARWLDELVADGKLTEQQRVALAAEDGAATLTTLLRRVELAGHDPHQILTDAVARRSLDDARQITNVLHRRISGTTSLDPVGDTYTKWIPAVDDRHWTAYLITLAEAADQRRDELGRQVAAEQPQWAVEALGSVPQADRDRLSEWTEAAATVAAYRELAGHDDAADALGPAPKPGQIETYAAWRAAWRALGRPEADRAEAELSTGQLRIRVRAYEREQTWAPPYVANELAGTRQAADKHRHDAAVRHAEATAAAAGDPEQRARLLREANEAAALADALDARAAELVTADEARAHWYAHTAETRAAAERARAELSARDAGLEPTLEDRPLTSEEWLEAHAAADRAEDPHRAITDEHDLTDLAQAREHDQAAATSAEPSITSEAAYTQPEHDVHQEALDPGHPADQAAKAAAQEVVNELNAEWTETDSIPATSVRDQTHREGDATETAENDDTTPGAAPPAAGATPIGVDQDATGAGRLVRADEPQVTPRDIRQDTPTDQDRDTEAVRVPSADETAASVRRAQRALTELRNRQAAEQQRAADEARERDDELAHWNTHDHADDHADDRAAGDHTRYGDRADDAARGAAPTGGRPAHARPDHSADGPVLEVTLDDY